MAIHKTAPSPHGIPDFLGDALEKARKDREKDYIETNLTDNAASDQKNQNNPDSEQPTKTQ